MEIKYAKDQPKGFNNRIERIAIVGANGQLGKYITKELVRGNRHTITALTRAGSSNIAIDGVKVVTVDYDDHQSLVKALQNQQFLVVTLSVRAPPDTCTKLIRAAAEAKVPYVMPNMWGGDVLNEALRKDVPIRADTGALTACEELGVSWIALACGLWYEYSLVMGLPWFGFDLAAKKLTLYDDGTTRINVSTFEQCARAVAHLLSLKELPDDESDSSPTVSQWRNKPLYMSSFLVSQKDMFESWKRVTGDRDEDWTIDSEGSKERYERGMSLMQNSSDPMAARMGAALASFVRVFYPNGGGDYETSRGLDNDALGLPKEDLDERTKVAKTMLDEGYANWVMQRNFG